MPEPKPTPPAPEPPPEPKKPSVRAKAGPVNQPPGPKERFLDAVVSFDDFTDWCVTTGRAPMAKEWFKAAADSAIRRDGQGADKMSLSDEYDFVPDPFWKALETDAIGVGKAITLYGKAGAQ